MRKDLLVASVLCASLSLAGNAASAAETFTVYVCDFVIRGSGGEKSKLVIATDSSNRSFTYENKPGSDKPVRIPVSARKGGPDQVIYSYAVDVPNVDGQTGRFDIQARIPAGGGQARVSMRGRGYVGTTTGDGTCTLERNVRLPY
jgi:hypothetical protein